MTQLLSGFGIGFLFAFILRLFVLYIREKKGLREVRSTVQPLSSKMKLLIREIIFKYSIQTFNRDFLLNVKVNDIVIMQIMHRSHFPEILKNTTDVKFGLAIYIPVRPLTLIQKQQLLRLLKEESESFHLAEYPLEYFVIDSGTRVRYTGYLVARIVRDVFGKKEVDVALYDEGILPYHYKLRIPKGS